MSNSVNDNDEEPVYIAYCVDDMAKSPKDLFRSVKDVSKFVNSPEGKSYGARFKKFGTPKEARDFLAAGDTFLSPRNQETKPQTPIAGEPASPFSGVNRIQMNEFKKYIEKGDMEGFLRLVDTNPRYLVNTGGDVASIVMEGFRYNALHIAAKAGQTEIVRQLLQFIWDCDFLERLYGTSKDDVLQRRPNIIDSYLNTPDKGNCDTPLHFASKFGKVGIVREFSKQKYLDKTIRNKAGKTALESTCERYNESDKSTISKEIETLIQGYHVLLLRDINDTPSLMVSQKIEDPLENSKICAIAGPFANKKSAEEFKGKWMTAGKETKRTDFDKGYEKVGRTLCGNYVPRIRFSEFWRFLGVESMPIDVASEDGLAVIEQFFSNRRKENITTTRSIPSKIRINEERPSSSIHVRRRLDFNILDDNAGDSDNNLLDDSFEEDGDIYYDTLPYSDSEPFNDDDDLANDSLAELTGRLAALTFESPVSKKAEVKISDEVEEDDSDEFETPPCTPPPTFVIDDMPCKFDNDLFEVLSMVPKEIIEKFPMVAHYVNKLGRLNPTVRCHWPGIDSPRRASPSIKLSKFN